MKEMHHKELGRTIRVPDSSVPVLEKSGWTTDVPKSSDRVSSTSAPAADQKEA